jgi:hypothetical protein
VKTSVVSALLKGCKENQEEMLKIKIAGMGILHNLEATGFHMVGNSNDTLPPEFREKWGVGTVKAFNTILRGGASVRQQDILAMIVYAERAGLKFDVHEGVENLFAVQEAA